MSKLTLALSLALVLTLATPAAAAPAHRVDVNGERISLGEIVPSAPESLRSLDLGPAPTPGKSQWITRRQVRRRLKQAMVADHSVAMPRRIRVHRPGQTVSELRLRSLVRQVVRPLLPAGASLRNVLVSRGLMLPRGDIELRVGARSRRPLSAGKTSLPVSIRAGACRWQTLLVTVDIDVPRIKKMAVRRGDAVTIVARGRGLEVRAKGVVQRDGAIGETVPVLPSFGQKMLHARVRHAHRVELEL